MVRRDTVILVSLVAATWLLSFLCIGVGGGAVAADPGEASEASAAKAEGPAPGEVGYVLPEAEWSILNKICSKLFYRPLHGFFDAVDRLLLKLPDRAANYCGVGLFLSAMVWVGLILNKDYVNRGRPYKSIWSDLRLWTVLSMAPHVLVYFYFR